MNLFCSERVANFLEEVRSTGHFSSNERSFVLEVMLQQLREDRTNEQLALPWAAISSRLMAEHGLGEARHLVDSVLAACHSAALPGSSAFGLVLHFASGALELGGTADVLAVLPRASLLSRLLSRSSSPSEWLAQLAAKIIERRQQLLGPDRPVDELVRCFQAARAPQGFQAHLCSFDGTPIVALPPAECEQLRTFILLIDDHEVSRNPAQLRADAQAHAADFRATADLASLAKLVATLREGLLQVTCKRPFRVQCMCVGGFLLHQVNGLSRRAASQVRRALKGRLGQVATGEGKSLIVVMLALANALQGRFVDIITSTQSLARRDVGEFHELFDFFGVSVSSIAVEQPTKEDFNGRVLYGTNTDFEFAILRDGVYETHTRQTEVVAGQWVPRPSDVAIVDESDNLFLDASLNAARIAYPTGISFTWAYAPIFHLVKSKTESAGSSRAACPTPAELRAHLQTYDGGAHAAQLASLDGRKLQLWMDSAMTALYKKRREIDYVVHAGQVVIVDVDTGRLQRSSRWSAGLHEMVEVKEQVKVRAESATIASLAHPSFFEHYDTVYGITGTVGEPQEREEVQRVYGLDSFDVPPHQPCRRERWPTRVFPTQEQKWQAMLESVCEVCRTRAVLILVPNILESLGFSQLLAEHQIHHQVFNDRQKEDEVFLIHKAGQKGAVTVATNTAGRGTDIKLSPALLETGGLHVIFGCMPVNLRVECQGLGRSGRQGQPGSNQIFIARDEPLVKEFLERCTDQAAGEAGTVKCLYDARTMQVLALSQLRERLSARERVLYQALCLFFEDQTWLAAAWPRFLPRASEAYAAVAEGSPGSPVLGELYRRLRLTFRWQWAAFFSERSERGELQGPEELYGAFLEQAQWYLSHHKLGDKLPEVSLLRTFFAHYLPQTALVA